MTCPKCKNLELTIEPHPTKADRVQGFCKCNPLGPVYEGPAKTTTRRTTPKSEPAKEGDE